MLGMAETFTLKLLPENTYTSNHIKRPCQNAGMLFIYG